MESDEDNSPTPPGPPLSSPPDLPPPLPARPRKTNPQPPIPPQLQDEAAFDGDGEVEAEDEISQQMTASYSEISFKSGMSPENEMMLNLSMEHLPLEDHITQRPVTLPCSRNVTASKPLGPLNLEGTIHKEGNMMHFVAEDLEYKIKLSSPVTKKGDTPPLPGGSRSDTPSILNAGMQVGRLDSKLLNDLESEARKLATSVDNLTENLCGILHSISSITADNVDVYKDAVSKMSDSMDSNIKSMYTIMAKAEEVTQAMKSVQIHATRIRDLKRLVDLFESFA